MQPGMRYEWLVSVSASRSSSTSEKYTKKSRRRPYPEARLLLRAEALPALRAEALPALRAEALLPPGEWPGERTAMSPCGWGSERLRLAISSRMASFSLCAQHVICAAGVKRVRGMCAAYTQIVRRLCAAHGTRVWGHAGSSAQGLTRGCAVSRRRHARAGAWQYGSAARGPVWRGPVIACWARRADRRRVAYVRLEYCSSWKCSCLPQATCLPPCR
jgi:hypothetical protein